MAGELLASTIPEASAIIDDHHQNGSGNKEGTVLHQQELDGYSALVLSFPSSKSFSDPKQYISPLRDNHSKYNDVAKTCLLLNQFATNGSSKASSLSSSSSQDENCNGGSMEYVESSSLFHDSSFAQSLSDSFAALLECISEHNDRRARIIACKTIALMARSAYARLRKSPHFITGMRDDTNTNNTNNNSSNSPTAGNNYTNRLDDEIGTDIPMALCVTALEDTDDGVAATAMSSLGIMVLSTTSTPGTLVDDELSTEVRSIAQAGGGQQPYAPSLKALVDDDAAIQQQELQVRIYENIICPRLLQLVSRFMILEHPSHVTMVIPILVASLVYLSKTAVPVTGSMYNNENDQHNSNTHKIGELDYNSLIEIMVKVILLPWMQESKVMTMGATVTAALSSIRLLHACPLASWVSEVSHWVIMVLKEECNNDNDENSTSPSCICLETQLSALATLIVVSRVIPLSERVSSVFEFVVHRLLELPSTSTAPSGIVSAGLLIEVDKFGSGAGRGQIGGGPRNDIGCMAHYRKPTRPAFWAEIALGFFMDGPVSNISSSSNRSNGRSMSLTIFLESSRIMNILEDDSDDDTTTGTQGKIREELVTAFCMVAFRVGRRHRSSAEGGASQLIACHKQIEEWVRLVMALLDTFSPCVGWGTTPPYMDEEMTMLIACQASYTRLLQEVLHVSGMLNAESISLKMTPFSSPPHILWDQIEESSEYLVRFDPMPLMDSMTKPIENLMNDIVKREMKGAGVVSHHMRIFLMSLAADQWMQARHVPSTKAVVSSSSEIGMSVDNAKQLLVTISPRRMFGKVVESNKSQIENYSKSKREKYKKFAQDTVSVCVACIESMALMACHYTKRFGSTNDTKAVLNYSVKSLQGKVGNDSDSPILPVCQAAIERIQSAFQSGDRIVTDHILLSPLVPNDFKRRRIISSSRINQGHDAFNESYFMQLSRQIISSRTDKCIYSFPPVYGLSSNVRKQNWLRLSLPPLPQSRNPQVSVAEIPRFIWGSNVAICTAGSDPASVTLAYSMRRSMRYDGEDDFRLMVTLRVHNLTAVEVPNGLRLELGITEENIGTSADAQDVVSLEISKSLTEGFENVVRENTFGSSVVTYNTGLKSGDHLTWEMTMNPLPMKGTISLSPTITFHALEKEIPYACCVTADTSKKEAEETSVTSGNSKSKSEGTGEKNKPDKELRQNIVMTGEPMELSPMIGLQPCPFVFFRDGLGDVDSFRFLWSRMPCQLNPFKLVTDPKAEEKSNAFFDAIRLAAISTVTFKADPVSAGILVTRLWAFMSPRGKRILFVLGEQEGDKSKTLHVCGDDKDLLLCVVGTSNSRNSLISALQPGFISALQEIFN